MKVLDTLNNLNTTNFRIVASVCMAVIYVLVVIVGLVIGRKIDGDTMSTLQWFMLGMMGIDAASYIGKRFSDSGYAAAKAATPAPTVAAATANVVLPDTGDKK